jgi:hypothetical protein
LNKYFIQLTGQVSKILSQQQANPVDDDERQNGGRQKRSESPETVVGAASTKGLSALRMILQIVHFET